MQSLLPVFPYLQNTNDSALQQPEDEVLLPITKLKIERWAQLENQSVLEIKKVTTLVKFPSKETKYMLILLVGLLLFKNKQTSPQNYDGFSKSCQTIQDGGSFFRILIFSSIIFDSSKNTEKRSMLLLFFYLKTFNSSVTHINS